MIEFETTDTSPRQVHSLARDYWKAGSYERAVECFLKACAISGNSPTFLVSAVQALMSLARSEQAIELLERAGAQESGTAIILLLHALCQFDDRQPSAVINELQAAVEADPQLAEARLVHGMVLQLLGRPFEEEELTPFLNNPRSRAIYDGFRYYWRHRDGARLFGLSTSVLVNGLTRILPAPGLVLEFGVFHGRSLRLIAERVDGPVHGFDSFCGLPEDWTDAEPAGTYNTNGLMPDVPSHVFLHAGWFDQTLPEFLDGQQEPARFVHIDCDLYSSTRTVLDVLHKRLQPGTILVFDDYLGYPGWEKHEFRAFQAFVNCHKIEYRYLGFALLGREVAIQIVRT